ncbi:MAG TPA: hypothetical protein VFS69_00460 [Sphingomicrobium sp.]|nr:hypothetical protein [Sphingomicrobium sp.]
MARPDPVPSSPQSTLQRFKKAMAWMGLLSLVVAAIAVILVARGDPEIHIHMLIATALGVFFTVLLGTGLMVLTFLSAQSGHDDEVSRHKEDV